jgi:hypothetical protein
MAKKQPTPTAPYCCPLNEELYKRIKPTTHNPDARDALPESERNIEAAYRAAARMSQAAYESQGYAKHVLAYYLAGGTDFTPPPYKADNVGRALLDMFAEIREDQAYSI